MKVKDKDKRRLSYILITVLMGLALTMMVLPTHGQPTNSGVCIYLNSAASQASYTFTIAAPSGTFSGSCTFSANFLVVLIVQTYSSTVTVSSITDNAGGNSYGQIVGQTNTLAQTGFCATTNGMASSM